MSESTKLCLLNRNTSKTAYVFHSAIISTWAFGYTLNHLALLWLWWRQQLLFSLTNKFRIQFRTLHLAYSSNMNRPMAIIGRIRLASRMDVWCTSIGHSERNGLNVGRWWMRLVWDRRLPDTQFVSSIGYESGICLVKCERLWTRPQFTAKQIDI